MILTDIQKLQFSDKPKAEEEFLRFLKDNEDDSIENVELHPRPQSLNSINGFISYKNGERYFFKTHTEENEQVSEYYNADVLDKAGYPIYQARQITHKPGKQIVLYEIISLPTLFDLIKTEEDNLMHGANGETKVPSLLRAQEKLDRKVFEIYENCLTTVDATKHKMAPVHQLFSHRLAEDGRIGFFYRGKSLFLDNGQLPFEELAKKRWVINGVEYKNTLEELIIRSRSLLEPGAGPAVIGHGDAHNGNLFVDLENEMYYMFDPAFAGLHHPLIDLTKPTFHNIFARWMYYPEQVSKEFELNFRVTESEITIEHTFMPSELRLSFLELRKKHVLKPTFELLSKRGMLADDWRNFLRSSLFCCAFLTVNLLAESKSNGTLAERYSLPIKLLGYALAIELGSEYKQNSNKLADIINDLLIY
jgi:Phosphotransferase enzyme family